MKRAALLFWLLCSPLWAQINVETRVRLDGPSGADLYTWTVTPEVSFEGQGGPTIYLSDEAPAGDYKVSLVALTIGIDWDARTKKIERQSFVTDLKIKCGKEPTPVPPGPDPNPNPTPVPPDEFNLGPRAQQWAREGLSAEAKAIAPQIGQNFLDVAKELENGTITSIEKATEEAKRRNGLLFPSQEIRARWAAWGARINEVWEQHWPLERLQVVQFYKIVGSALKSL